MRVLIALYPFQHKVFSVSFDYLVCTSGCEVLQCHCSSVFACRLMKLGTFHMLIDYLNILFCQKPFLVYKKKRGSAYSGLLEKKLSCFV